MIGVTNAAISGEKMPQGTKDFIVATDKQGNVTKLGINMNKISNVSSVTSAAAREGQGSLRKAGDVGEHRNIEAGPSSKVALTGMALAMAKAERIAEETPLIDEKRVDAIRAAIADGSYSIDAERIASVLLAMENDLPAE